MREAHLKSHFILISINSYSYSYSPIRRYIAVTQPIKYAKHKNSRRVCLTILLVWAISAAIGSPIVLGLNNTPNREPDVCAFYNADFILYSSLSSFYIPCIIMVFLYWNIFKVSKQSPSQSQQVSRTKSEQANQKRISIRIWFGFGFTLPHRCSWEWCNAVC